MPCHGSSPSWAWRRAWPYGSAVWVQPSQYPRAPRWVLAEPEFSPLGYGDRRVFYCQVMLLFLRNPPWLADPKGLAGNTQSVSLKPTGSDLPRKRFNWSFYAGVRGNGNSAEGLTARGRQEVRLASALRGPAAWFPQGYLSGLPLAGACGATPAASRRQLLACYARAWTARLSPRTQTAGAGGQARPATSAATPATPPALDPSRAGHDTLSL